MPTRKTLNTNLFPQCQFSGFFTFCWETLLKSYFSTTQSVLHSDVFWVYVFFKLMIGQLVIPKIPPCWWLKVQTQWIIDVFKERFLSFLKRFLLLRIAEYFINFLHKLDVEKMLEKHFLSCFFGYPHRSNGDKRRPDAVLLVQTF